MTFALNHLAYFHMTLCLMDVLMNAEKARIISVSSGAHSGQTFDFNNLQNEGDFIGKIAYGQSKLANILFTYELARKLKGTQITVNALHPGGVATNFCRNNGIISWGKHILAHTLARNLVSPQEGAKTSVYLAVSKEVEGISGQYFVKNKQVQSSVASHDENIAQKLWQVSLQLTGLSDIDFDI